MAAGGEGDGDKSAFRCLDAARYVAAAVVIVLIAAVVVNAIRVVLRPEDIRVSVLGSSVITATEQVSLSFQFTLLAKNPSGRVRLDYYNITAYVFVNDTMATTPTPEDNCTMLFDEVDDMSLLPMQYVENTIQNYDIKNDSDVIEPSFFDALYKKGGTVGGVTMRVYGQLVSEIRSGINTTAQDMTLYCRGLVFGPEDKVATMSSQDTSLDLGSLEKKSDLILSRCILDLSHGVKLPSVALVFDRGATVELDPSGVVMDGCLAFFSTGDDTTFGIVGNVQQRTFEVLYDVGGQAVGFRRGAC